MKPGSLTPLESTLEKNLEVYSKNLAGNVIKRSLIDNDMGIVIVHKGKEYHVSIDNHGRLQISANDQIIVKPRASNSIHIESE